LEPRLEEAKAGNRAVFFVDAAHFVLGAYLGVLWCFERLFVKTGSGRQRFNVLAAMNALTHELVLVTNDAYINAQSVCDTNLKSEQGRSKRMQGCNLDGDDAPKIICHLHRLNWYNASLSVLS